MRYSPRNIRIACDHAGLTHFGGVYFFREFLRVPRFRNFLSRHLRYPRRNHRYSVSQMMLALVYPLVLGLDRLETASFLLSNGAFQYLTGLPSFPDPQSFGMSNCGPATPAPGRAARNCWTPALSMCRQTRAVDYVVARLNLGDGRVRTSIAWLAAGPSFLRRATIHSARRGPNDALAQRGRARGGPFGHPEVNPVDTGFRTHPRDRQRSGSSYRMRPRKPRVIR